MFKSSRGFTLIELLVVIAIIGILSSVVLASLNSTRMKARDARRSADINQVRAALEMYHSDYGSYPQGRSASGTLVADNSGSSLPGTIQFGLVGYMQVVRDPLYAGVSGDYGYVRAPGGQSYGLRIYYEQLAPTYTSCKTGADINLGWWGTLAVVPLCEEVL